METVLAYDKVQLIEALNRKLIHEDKELIGIHHNGMGYVIEVE